MITVYERHTINEREAYEKYQKEVEAINRYIAELFNKNDAKYNAVCDKLDIELSKNKINFKV